MAQRIGPYELREELGRGGLGQVWRAWDPGLRREVALKVLLRETWQLTPDQRERFAREGEAHTRVRRDPGLAEVYHLDLLANPPYLVMELIPGETLARRLEREGPLPVPDVLQLGLALARTLGRLHAAGVVHRDLKPANVVLRPDGQPVLLDLGLALLLERSARLTVSGEIMGTPGYLPPEQASGQAGQMGTAADVYGLGAVLFALLTGVAPFQGSGMAALEKVLTQEAPAPSSLRPGIPAALNALVRSCLRKRPEERPGMAQVAEDLAGGLSGGRSATHARGRGRAPLVAAALLVVGGTGAAAFATWGSPQTQGPAATPSPGPESVSPPQPDEVPASRAVDTGARDKALERGGAKLEAGDYPGAIADFDQAIALDPRLALAYFNRGLARAQLKQWQESIADFDQAIALDPRLALAYFNRGLARATLAQFQEAIPDFDQAIALRPRLALAYAYRGAARERLGEHREAIADCDQAIALDPRLALAHAYRGAARKELGELQEAITDYERFLKLGPQDPMAEAVRQEVARLRAQKGEQR